VERFDDYRTNRPPACRARSVSSSGVPTACSSAQSAQPAATTAQRLRACRSRVLGVKLEGWEAREALPDAMICAKNILGDLPRLTREFESRWGYHVARYAW